MKKPVRLYFVCIQNRCRSQIAEAYAKHFGGEHVITYSGGIETTEMHPLTIEAMMKDGIDISMKESKPIDLKTYLSSHAVIKLCEESNERCPIVPFGIMNVQWNIPDPLIEGAALEDVCKARDEIKAKVLELLTEMNVSIP